MKIEYELIKFNENKDVRGNLTSISYSEIPFAIKRTFFIYDTAKNVVRGLHSLKKCNQVLVCITGSCKIKIDNGKNSKYIILDSPKKGLVIHNNVWREMSDFSKGAVLVVFADSEYDENDYIRNYDEYLKYIGVK